ncbi:MAG: recombinase family protein [Pseudomonadota bacterium]
MGYDPDGRTLAVNEDEARTVRTIYDLYDQHGTLRLVHESAQQLQLRSKTCRLANGNMRGGHIMSRGLLHHILTNPIYAGRIRHKGQVFNGQHRAIIDPDRWDELQDRLAGRSAKKRRTKQHRDPAPLAGKLFDEAGEKLTPSHTKKGNHRYRYYISKKLVTGVSQASERQQTWRIRAAQLEEPIADAVQSRVCNLQRRHHSNLINTDGPTPIEKSVAFDLIEQVILKPGQLTLTLLKRRVRTLLAEEYELAAADLQIALPFTERRRGVEMKLMVGETATVDQRLLRNLAKANHWYARIKQGATFEEIAVEAGTSKRRVQQMIHLALLAPDIVRRILQGRQPLGLTSNWLLRHDMPTNWDAQRKRIANL